MNFGLLASVIFSIGASVWDELPDRFAACVHIVNAEKRLQCFDALSGHFINDKKSIDVLPTTEFLESELRVNKARSDFHLRVSGFIAMLADARLDGGKPIEIYRWERQGNQYTLVINMRTTTRLQFTHSHNADKNFSVLAPVLLDGTLTDPALFVLNIAAMTPDE